MVLLAAFASHLRTFCQRASCLLLGRGELFLASLCCGVIGCEVCPVGQIFGLKCWEDGAAGVLR